MSEKLGEAILELRTSDQGYSQGLDTARQRAEGLDRGLGGVSARAVALGGLVAQGARMAVQALGEAIETAGNFDESLNRIVGLVGVQREQVDEWRQAILAMAPAVRTGPEELADALFFITSAGVKGKEALDLLQASAMAAAGGLGETKTVADAATSAMNAYGLENLSGAEAVGVLVAAVREGKMEASALAGVMGRVIAPAAELGVEFNEVGAIMAALSRTTGSAEMSATQLGGILAKIIKPTELGRKELRKYGVEVDEVRRIVSEDGLLAALNFLMDTFDGNAESAGKFFEEVQALNGVLALTGESSETVAQIVENMASMPDNVTAIATAFEETNTGINATKERMAAAVDAIGIKLIDLAAPVVIPWLEEMLKNLQWVTGWIDQFPPKVTEAMGTIARFVAQGGPAGLIIRQLIGNPSDNDAEMSKFLSWLENKIESAVFSIPIIGPILSGAKTLSNALRDAIRSDLGMPPLTYPMPDTSMDAVDEAIRESESGGSGSGGGTIPPGIERNPDPVFKGQGVTIQHFHGTTFTNQEDFERALEGSR